MATNLVRREGLLYEEETPSLMDRVAQAGLEQPPTTPAGAQALGGTQQQVAMAGTPAQKKPVLEQAVKKTETLQGAQRLEAPREVATGAEQSAATKAQQLAQLGSLGTRVQSLIEGELKKGAQQALGQARVSGDAVSQMLGLNDAQLAAQKADPNSQYNQVTTKLQQYAADPQNQQVLAELAGLGLTPAQAAQASQMWQSASQATGTGVAEAVANQATLGQLDVTQMGYASMDELAGTLGVTPQEAATMTVPQLQQRVADLQQETFSRIQTLQAQLAGMPPGSAQRQLIQRELADLGQVGVAGVEAQVAQTAADIQLADQVKVGNRQMSVEQALKDQNISDLIQDYISASPEQREAILPSAIYGDLRQWVDNNYAALGELVGHAQETQQQFSQAQQDYQAIGQLGGVQIPDTLLSQIIPGYMPGSVVTSDQVAAAQQTLASSPIGQLAQSDVPNKSVILSSLGPADLQEIQQRNLSAAQVADAFNRAEAVRGDAIAQQLMGGDEVPQFMWGVGDQNRAMYALAASKQLADAGATHLAQSEGFRDLLATNKIPVGQLKDWLTYKDVLDNDEIIGLIGDRKLTLKNAGAYLKDAGTKLSAHASTQKLEEQANNAKDLDELLAIVFGGSVTASTLNNSLSVETRKILDTDKNGIIDNSDLAGLKRKVGDTPDVLTFLKKGTDAGDSLFSSLQKTVNKEVERVNKAIDYANNTIPSIAQAMANLQVKTGDQWSTLATADQASILDKISKSLTTAGISPADAEAFFTGAKEPSSAQRTAISNAYSAISEDGKRQNIAGMPDGPDKLAKQRQVGQSLGILRNML